MTKRLGVTSWATGALVLAAVTACGGNATDQPTGRSTTSASAATSSVSPTSPSGTAATEATALLRRYFEVIDQLSQQPTSDLSTLNSVAVSTELSAEHRFLTSEHKHGEKQVGSTRIAKTTVQSVSLDNSNPTTGNVPTIIVDACWDVTHVDVVDRSGKSILSSSRPDTGWTRYTIANYHYAADPDGGWRVASAQDLERTPCAPS